MHALLLQPAQIFCSALATAARKGKVIAQADTNVKAAIYPITAKSISFRQDLPVAS
jgi:hypothetical protein